mgnify:CR=1 FL=1
MRLKSIKLAGFKSFVDPTTVHFPSNMCAVVGPNGCGKSNVIDAVRWVMGESSAKNLRGESMTDVIFNGSGNRKPIGQASIELLFDNSEGTLGGEYAKYAEISIRRVVTREGESQYYLNTTKCRRRDITDIFLGTGLGPRSYAIIEQGMISRLVESKPEELRVFIEEAAGISKYKERRRDTESRMRRTFENLERLTDIRDELERHLQHLQRQSQAAEKYTEFRKDERLLKVQLQALQWQVLNVETKTMKSAISQHEVDFEAAVAEQRKIDANIEGFRLSHTDRSDKLNEVQGNFYSLGTEVARIEQTIQHQVERTQQLTNDIKQIDEACQQARQHLADDRGKLKQWQIELEDVNPKLHSLQTAEEESATELLKAEESMQHWQQEWDGFNQRAAEPRQTAEVQQSRIKHIEQVLQRAQERISRLEGEKFALGADSDEQESAELEEKIAESELTLETQQKQMADFVSQIHNEREANTELATGLDSLRNENQQMAGRYASLEALQQASLGDKNDELGQWLSSSALDKKPRLAEILDVEPFWQIAVETVLGDYLQAICVDGVSALEAAIESFEGGRLVLLEASDKVIETSTLQLPTLTSKVGDLLELGSLLSGVYTTESLSEALAFRTQLEIQESIVTADGIWIGPNWLRVARVENSEQGMLSRLGAMETLEAELEFNRAHIVEIEDKLSKTRHKLKTLETHREDLQAILTGVIGKHSELQSMLSEKKVKIEQTTESRIRINSEIEENRRQFQTEQELLGQARTLLHEALETMGSDTENRGKLLLSRDQTRTKLDEVRQNARHDKDSAHQLAMRIQSLKTQIDGIQLGIERTSNQVQQLEKRRQDLCHSMEINDNPLDDLKTQLETQLDKRLNAERELTEARQSLAQVEHELREVENQRGMIEQKAQNFRGKLETLRIESEGVQVRAKALQDQIQDSDFELGDVLAELPENSDENTWKLSLERIDNRINRLGPINLAAIDEYKQQFERKNYLDAQDADLQRALETLGNAIRKIDKETRNRFKETFDQINNGLQELFPKVFGGGTAYLEMTGEDLLSTGVAIMARPPGKRNSTIHLLSGGEKALTAIALVFSIFRLNPAPFCMLDEVDAPLDDANVSRYARMVKEMSEQVQFIYITHNKISMEMADQLMGVTMYEPGVSRLVTVDVEEAAELAAI